jgi:hypothetical protein
MPHHAIVSDFQVGDLSIKTRLKRGEEWPINGGGTISTMAARSKYLARSNKSLERIKATKKQNRQ